MTALRRTSSPAAWTSLGPWPRTAPWASSPTSSLIPRASSAPSPRPSRAPRSPSSTTPTPPPSARCGLARRAASRASSSSPWVRAWAPAWSWAARLIAGAFGAGGEIGHITVERDEPLTCGCGRHGCLEQYASAKGVVRLYLEECERRVVKPVDVEHATDTLSVFQALSSGDECAAIAIDKMCDYLALAMSQISCIVDPGMYLIGGGVAGGFSTFAPKLRETLPGACALAVPRRQDRGRRPRQPGGHVRLRVRGAAPSRRAAVAAPRPSRLPAKPRFWVSGPPVYAGGAYPVTLPFGCGNKFMCCQPFAGFASIVLPTSEKNVASFNPGACHQSRCPQRGDGTAAPRRALSPTSFSPLCKLSVMGARGSFNGLRAPIPTVCARDVLGGLFRFALVSEKRNHRGSDYRQMVSFTEPGLSFAFFRTRDLVFAA